MGMDIQILYEPKPSPAEKAEWLSGGQCSKGYLRESYGCGGIADELHEFVFGYEIESIGYEHDLQGPEGDKAVHVPIADLITRLKVVINKIWEEDQGDFDPYSREALDRIIDCVEFVKCAIADATRNNRDYVRIVCWA